MSIMTRGVSLLKELFLCSRMIQPRIWLQEFFMSLCEIISTMMLMPKIFWKELRFLSGHSIRRPVFSYPNVFILMVEIRNNQQVSLQGELEMAMVYWYFEFQIEIRSFFD